jgi:hypothetical protein
MPIVATISLDFARFSSFAETPPNQGLYRNPVSPRNFARYSLYNRDFPLENFKINDNAYLTYEGGFLTEDDKINFKNSDFEIRTVAGTNQGGNLFVSGSSKFFSNIDILTRDGEPKNHVTNVRRLQDVNDLKVNTYDTDAMTVGDFKNYMYQPGMIMFFRGTFDFIRNNLPYWRICALPDANQTVTSYTGQQVTIPNLLGKFFPGSQPVDVLNPTPNGYLTGNIGGHDAIKLTLEETPIHNHNVKISLTGQEKPTLTGHTTFFNTGGTITVSNSYARTCSVLNKTCTCGCKETGRRTSCTCGEVCEPFGGNCWCCGRKTTVFCGGTGPNVTTTAPSNVTSVTSLNITTYKWRTIKSNHIPALITSQGESDRGGGLAHENRPQFYTLIPIIYVGVAR